MRSSTPTITSTHRSLPTTSCPSAVHMAVSRSIHQSLIPALDDLRAELDRLARDNDHVVKIGRTHLMDAVPVMLGQEFGGMARSMELARLQVMHSLDRLMELPLGVTAVGTVAIQDGERSAVDGIGPGWRPRRSDVTCIAVGLFDHGG